ncbi:MAG: RsmD family RNA methyltransferase [Methanosarcinales archaeon]|nr:RsmD family RNA methyltransferase [Methanosarcinales archaeon]
MTLIAFELSGEHPDLPAAEVIGVLQAENVGFSLYYQLDQILVIEVPGIIISQMNTLANRLAMTWYIIEVLGISGAEFADILKMAEGIEFEDHISRTYNIRTKKIKHKSHISSEEIERGIGKILYDKGFKANLKAPDIRYRAIISDSKCIFGKVLECIDRSVFETRNPQNKPFFYPGVLMPRLARAVVNIARVRQNDIVLDPYSGTGGLIIEAGLIGAVTVGCDVQKMIINGAKLNLDFYGVNYSVFLQDAGDMAIRDNCVNIVLTDPPYGRSALIQAQSLEQLMMHSLNEIYRILRFGGRAVLVSECNIEEWAEDSGFVVSEVYTQRVHRSLTRRISVLEKV